MANVFLVTCFYESNQNDVRRVTIYPDGSTSVVNLERYQEPPEPLQPIVTCRRLKEEECKEMIFLDPPYTTHDANINFEEYIKNIKRECLPARSGLSQKRSTISENEIARRDQAYVLKLTGNPNKPPLIIAENPISTKTDEEAANCFGSVISDAIRTTLDPLYDEIGPEAVPSSNSMNYMNQMHLIKEEEAIVERNIAISWKQVEESCKEIDTSMYSKEEALDKDYIPSIHNSKENSGAIIEIMNIEDIKEEIPARPFPCQTCGQAFKSEAALDRHMLKHYNEELRNKKNPKQTEDICRCAPCGRVFPDQTQIAVHIISAHSTPNDSLFSSGKSKHDENGRTDGSDDYMDITADDVDIGLQINAQCELVNRCSEDVVASSLLQCEFCECVFVESNSLFIHTKSHRGERNYECLNCCRAFSSYGQAIGHWQAECSYTKNETTFTLHKYLICNICERKFVGWDQLYNHRYKNRHLTLKMFGQDNKEYYQCDQCCHLATDFLTLMDHRTKMHPCSLKATELAQKNHGQRSFLCEICGKAYTQSSHLWQHLRFHQGIKPFACTEPGCSRRFTIRPDLNDHIRKSHTGERPFHCTECNKRFLTGSVYYQHRLIHRGDRRYACTECDKRFYRADALKNHARIHSGEKPYRCTVCGRCFRQRGDRDKHVKVRHEFNSEENASKQEPAIINPDLLSNNPHMFIKNIPFPNVEYPEMESGVHAEDRKMPY